MRGVQQRGRLVILTLTSTPLMSEYDKARAALKEVKAFVHSRTGVQDQRRKTHELFKQQAEAAIRWMSVVTGHLNNMERNDYGKGENNDGRTNSE